MNTYPGSLKAFHWLLSCFIILQLSLIFLSRQMMSIEVVVAVVNAHISTGVLILALIIGRAILLPFAKVPALPGDTPAWQRWAAHTVHIGLFVTIAVQCILGMALTWQSGREVELFGLLTLPALVAENADAAAQSQMIHFVIGMTISGLLIIHLAAVAFNHIIRKRDVLSRILPVARDDRFKNHVPLGMQIFGAIGTLVLVCVLGAGYALNGLGQATKAGLEIYDGTVMSISHARSAQAGFYKLQKEIVLNTNGSVNEELIQDAIDQVVSDLEIVIDRSSSDQLVSEAQTLLSKFSQSVESVTFDSQQVTQLDGLEEEFEFLIQNVASNGFMTRFETETQAAVRRDVMIVSSVPLLLLATVIAAFVASNVIRSVKQAKKISQRIADGHYDNNVSVKGNGEAAQLVRALMDMQSAIVKGQQEALQMERARADAERQRLNAEKDRVELEQRRTAEAAAKERQRMKEAAESEALQAAEWERKRVAMMEKLRDAFGNVVTAAANGDFSVKVETQFEEPILNDLSSGLDQIMDSVSAGVGETGKVAKALADGDFTVRMEGNFKGSFAELQHDVNITAANLSEMMERERQSAEEIKRKAEEEKRAELLRGEERRQERDDMMARLRTAFGEVVTAAAEGNFNRKVDAHFDEPVLNDLADGMNEILASVEAGLTEACGVMDALANSDLRARMNGGYKGAFAQLQEDVNASAANLSNVIRHMQETVCTSTEANRVVLSGANELEEHAANQAASIEQTSASIQELTARVSENAERAGLAKQKSVTNSDGAKSCTKIMQEASQAMDRIISSSKQISEITVLIDKIAFQTNILALNAGVEAARAGEAGKGFAVVASEVRTLAQSAADASQHVRELTEMANSDVMDGVRLVQSASAELDTITRSSIEVANMMQAVSVDCEQQSLSLSEIQIAMQSLDQVTIRNLSLAERMNENAQQSSLKFAEIESMTMMFQTDGESVVVSRAA